MRLSRSGSLTLTLTLALAGCATPLKSTLPPATGLPDFSGMAGATVGPHEVMAQDARLHGDLEQRLAARDWGVPLQVGRTAEGFLRLRLAADESFEPGTAMLTPPAMLVLTETASALAQAPACVVHVLAHGADLGDEPAVSLSARRAAAAQSYLLARGLPATRVRAEWRGAREPAAADPAAAANRRLELVVRPVISGAEAQAWMPPLPQTACEACGGP